MLKIALISNPRSQRNKRGLEELRAAVARLPEVIHVELGDQPSLAGTVSELARQRVGLLVINGGDGTVQRLLTVLLEERAFDPLPPVAILPRGMANMTAGDVGLRGPVVRTLERLICSARAGEITCHLIARPVLRVENLEGMPPQRAMFFGAGAIYDAIELCCERVYARGLRGNVGMGVTLLGTLLSGLIQPRGNRVLRGHAIAVALDGGEMRPSTLLLALATTLERLVLGARPFWNRGEKPIHYTSVAYPPPKLIRSAPKVLYGWRRTSLPAASYRSEDADCVLLELETPITLDGELFRPTRGRPLRLTAPDSVRFVRL